MLFILNNVGPQTLDRKAHWVLIQINQGWRTFFLRRPDVALECWRDLCPSM